MRKAVLLFSAVVLSILMISPLSAQDRRGRRRVPSPPPQGQGEDHDRDRERQAEPRRQAPPPSRYAVPRNRPHPSPHPEFGPYDRRMHEGRYYFSRPYPRVWIRPNTCVAGYWDYDWWIDGYVWIEGYCNVRGFRPGPGFRFWFDFGR